MAARSEWENLLQQSSDLLSKDGQGLPWVQRDLMQVEEYSRRLRSRTSRLDSSEDRIAATRLLAGEGLNASRIARELDVFEIQPSYDDVFQVETATVSEYLKQVHDMTILTYMQQAQRDSMASFDDFMDECMEMDWAEEKRTMFEAMLPAGLSAQSYGTPFTSPASFGTPFAARSTPMAARSSPFPRFPASPSPFVAAPMSTAIGSAPPEATLQLDARAQGYLSVVQAMQSANAKGQPYNAIAAFATASEAGLDSMQATRAVSIKDIWSLLSRMVEKLDSIPASSQDNAATRTSTLLIGARQHLEAGHANYIQAIIQRNVSIARLGGSPSRLERVRALLRVMLKDEGVMDFDGGNVPTTWRQLHYCIRSGFYDEAKEVISGLTDFRAGDLTTAQLKTAFEEWLKLGGVADKGLVGHLQIECKKLLADRSRPTTSGSETRQKLQVLATLAGDKAAADQLLRDAPHMFPTIEDFMWFRIAVIRTQPQHLEPSGQMPYSLTDLQEYLCKYPATHYSKDGKEPLLYAMVLLLSLQFRQAVSYLAKEPSAQAHRVDALHIAAALVQHGLADAGGDFDTSSRTRNIDFSSLFHDYAQFFVRDLPQLALEYYMLAATSRAASDPESLLKVRATLLRELLLKSGNLALAACDGPLKKFVTTPQAHQELLSLVANECQLAAQLDEAVELYMEASRPVPALSIINRRLSNLIEEEASGSANASKLMEELIKKGQAAQQKIGAYPDKLAERREAEAFAQLLHVRETIRLSQQGRHSAVVQKLSELPFVPLEMHRVEKCAADISLLNQVVTDRLPQLLLAAARSLRVQYDASGQHGDLRTQLEAIRTFAGNTGVQYKFPTTTYQELARTCMV